MTVDTATKTQEHTVTNSATVEDDTLHTNGQQPDNGTDNGTDNGADDLLATLKRSAYAQDGYTFLDAIEGVDWSARPPDHIVDAAKFAVTVGASRLAMKLAQESVRLFPDNPRCQWAARVIAPGRVVGTKPSSGKDRGMRASMDWIEAHGRSYRKQWIAVSFGKLVASAPSYPELKELLKDEADPECILITRVL